MDEITTIISRYKSVVVSSSYKLNQLDMYELLSDTQYLY